MIFVYVWVWVDLKGTCMLSHKSTSCWPLCSSENWPGSELPVGNFPPSFLEYLLCHFLYYQVFRDYKASEFLWILISYISKTLLYLYHILDVFWMRELAICFIC